MLKMAYSTRKFSSRRLRLHVSYSSHSARRRHETYEIKVSNIPSNCSADKLKRLFRRYGWCDVVCKKGKSDLNMRSHVDSRYYNAYINYDYMVEARSAAREMHGYRISGTKLCVKYQDTELPVNRALSPAVSTHTGSTHTVKVTNISKSATESDLAKLFGFSGAVNVVSLKLNQTSTDANFAYVNYTSNADADIAVNALNGSKIKGSKLVVKHHKKNTQGTSAATGTSMPTSGSSVKIVITEGSLDKSELYDFFSQFGVLKDVPKIRLGTPNFAYVNFTNAADAWKASQYPSLQIKPGVTVKVCPPNDAPISVTPAGGGAASNSFQLMPKAPLLPPATITTTDSVFHTRAPMCESKKIQCGSVITQILTSSDPKYVQFQQSLLPVTINRDKSGSGIILFGAHTSLPAAESHIRAFIMGLQREHAEKEIELPCMYVPAFCNQALVNSVSEIEQECLVRFLVIIAPQCTQEIASFSTMVSSKLSSSELEAAKMASFSIPFYQKDPTDPLLNKPAGFIWSWTKSHLCYNDYDALACAKLNEFYSSSPQGSLELCIRSTRYLINLATMTQTNIKTGHVRKIKKSAKSSLSATWLYEDNSNSMVRYSLSECIDIETMYLSSKPSDLIINSKVYTFDFSRMKQINKSSQHERKIMREPSVTIPTTHESFFKLQISGLGSEDNFKKAEIKLVEKLDTAVVKKTHPLPVGADRAFQTEILQTLHKYFVLSKIVGENVQVQGVQGYIEKVMLILREKTLEVEKERVARAPVMYTQLGASLPGTWEPQSDQFDMKDVPRSSTEWSEIENEIRKTLSSLVISTIKRIQNKWLWDRYSFAKQRMSDRNAGVINERQLFHGTRSTPPEKIYKSEQGFDFRFSTKGMWGTGTYFAINASYSDNYCYQSPQGKQMILASVLTGETHRCPPNSSLKKPPIKPRKCGSFEDELYDSVSGYTNGSDVFIIDTITRKLIHHI